MLEVKNLSKKIGNKTALKNVSFTAPVGEISLFLGHSGGGKSTLLRTICSLEEYQEGCILYNEKKLTTLLNKNLVGMVFQHFNLFEHLSVERNITLCLEKCLKKNKTEAKDIAYTFLDQYGLSDKAKNSVAKLSGGEKQRLAIARTLSLDPSIICFDEPTSALDPILSIQVREMLEDLCKKGKTVLVATHDMNLALKLQANIHFMCKGALVESCTTFEFEKNKEQFPSISSFLSL